MKITLNTVEEEGNLQFDEEFAMQIDPSAFSLVIEALTKLYTDPYTAVLREYTSNAFDAHVSAGQTRPVEVSLPSKLSPVLTIQDWGVGMDRKTLFNYTQYGYSDKRDSNEKVGGFGFGSKSGLAIASQFTVISVKDGRKNVAVIGVRAGDGPKMGLLAEVATDEPNGTTISIPTSETDRFRSALSNEMFLAWAPGTILVDGTAPTQSIKDPAQYRELPGIGWVSVAAKNSSTYYRGDFRVAIGPVMYSVNWDQVDRNHEISSELVHGFMSGLVLNVPIGAVEMPRSRETLIYDKSTISYLMNLINAAVVEGAKDVQAMIDAAPDMRTVWTEWHRAKTGGYDKVKFTYKGALLTLDPWVDAHLTPRSAFGAFVAMRRTYNQKSRAGFRPEERVFEPKFFRYTNAMTQIINAKHVVVIENAPRDTRPETYGDHFSMKNLLNLSESITESDSVQWGDQLFILLDGDITTLPDWVQEFVTVTLTQDEVATRAKAIRSALAAANRGPRTPAGLIPLVSLLTTLDVDGRSRTTRTLADALDTTKTYVLFQTGVGLGEAVRDALFTVKHSRTAPTQVWAIGQLRSLGYEIIFANKTENVKKFSNFIKVISPEDAYKALAKERLAGKVGADMAQVQTYINADLYLVMRLVDRGATARIAAQETVTLLNHIYSVRSNKALATFVSGQLMSLAKLLGTDVLDTLLPGGVTYAQIKDENAALDVDPNLLYPLLPLLDNSFNAEDVDKIVDYINTLDTLAGRK